MKVHDRGTMKWTSLMLPEHVEQLREVFAEYKEKPLLDEQKRFEIDQKLKYGLEHQTVMEITYYDDGFFHTLISRLKNFDQWKGCVVLADENGAFISLSKICDVEATDTSVL